MLGQQQCFYEEDHQIDQNIHHNLIVILETSQGLKIVNPLTKETRILQISNSQLLMNWNDFLEKKSKAGNSNLSFSTEGELTFIIIHGNVDQLSPIYSYCVGRYIFKKGTSIIPIRNLKLEKDFQLRVIYNQDDRKQYYEKILLCESNQNQESSFDSIQTDFEDNILPEEIKIIQDLHRTYTPHILRVNSIFFDGTNYSYIYSKKDIIEITQYCNSILQKNLIVPIARQLLQLLTVLEEKHIIMPNLNHKSFYINPDTQEIVLVNYYQAFYANDTKSKRSVANIGYAPPETFHSQCAVTTKANVYQAGILLYYLIFGQTPYGQKFPEIVKNTLARKPNFSALKSQTPVLANFITLLLEKDPNKRLSPKELLKNKIFTPLTIEMFSKMSITQQEKIEDEFTQFDNISNIQQVRQTQLTKKH